MCGPAVQYNLPLTTCVQKFFVSSIDTPVVPPVGLARRPLSSVTASCHVLYSGAVLLSLSPHLVVDFSDSLLHFALQPLVDLLFVFILQDILPPSRQVLLPVLFRSFSNSIPRLHAR